MTLGEIIGFAGSLLVLLAYFPQISHLIKYKCSAGISRRAFFIWLISSLMLVVHSVIIKDMVFILLQIVNLIATAIILFYANRYKNMVCEYHKNKLPSSEIDKKIK